MCNGTSEFDAAYRPRMTVRQRANAPGVTPARIKELPAAQSVS
jgi:hypothetical protein